MADTNITPSSGELTLLGRHAAQTLPIFQLNGTDVVDGFVLPVYQLNGTDTVDGAVLPVFQLNGTDIVDGVVLPVYLLPGGGNSITTGVSGLVITGAAPTVVNSGLITITVDAGSLTAGGAAPTAIAPILRNPSTASLALTGATPTVVDSGKIRVIPTAASLSFTGTTVQRAASQALITTGAGALGLTGYAIQRAEGSPIPFEATTAYGVGVSGTTGTAAVIFERATATGTVDNPFSGSGIAQFAKMTTRGYAYGATSIAFKAMTATAFSTNAGDGTASFKPMAGVNAGAFIQFERLTASGTGGAVAADVFRTFAMNTRTGAVTEYQNFDFNSYAKIGNKYYAAGSGGLFLLEGATDNGDNIDWSLRLGRLDDKNPGLKRLNEVLLGLRQSGPVRVRIWSDDNVYNDYPMSPFNTSSLYQQRVVPGKGLRSRYYSVELQGMSNSSIELDAMQLNFTKTSRRLG